jgi:uncharacterized SAM-binding protein YcdF (DUF218 family)
MNRKFWLRLVLALVLLLSLEAGWTCWRIVHQASVEELQPASAIVVFGAAEYSGRPSPVYRARLDHAFDLYTHHLAPWVITTGGSGGDPSFSEGGVGAEYLAHRGIPESGLIAETQGTDTAQSALRVARILRTNKLKDCIAVSDAYHVFRIKRMLEADGITVYTAPRPNSLPHTRMQRTEAVLREAGSYFLWQLHIT